MNDGSTDEVHNYAVCRYRLHHAVTIVCTLNRSENVKKVDIITYFRTDGPKKSSRQADGGGVRNAALCRLSGIE